MAKFQIRNSSTSAETFDRSPETDLPIARPYVSTTSLIVIAKSHIMHPSPIIVGTGTPFT